MTITDIKNLENKMKFYYFNEPVILLEEVKEFSIAKIIIYHLNGKGRKINEKYKD